MNKLVLENQLLQLGVSLSNAKHIINWLQEHQNKLPASQCWQKLTKEILKTQYSFDIHLLLYKTIFPPTDNDYPEPVWFPDEHLLQHSNISTLIHDLRLDNYTELHQWSVTNFQDFWQTVIDTKLSIVFDKPYTTLVDLSAGVESPKWLVDAQLNIVKSCFQADKNDIAIISQTEQGPIIKTSYEELNTLSNRIANGLKKYLHPGERCVIIMPMSRHAIAIYLAILKVGGVVVGIPESFSSEEIAKRLEIAEVKVAFCQDQLIRSGKSLNLYDRIIHAGAPLTIVLPVNIQANASANEINSQAQAQAGPPQLRKQDILWDDFLSTDESAHVAACKPEDYINILFSSGTTGDPKAIPWDHTSPIKCASDAYFHHNLQPKDVFCWPTSLGWMMGPWLIFACLLNKATIAVYEGAPNLRDFGKFIQDAQVTHLGVVPTIVKTWRNSACMEGLNWKSMKVFTSTAERSNSEDMVYLMSLANYYPPVIEYCGGTEIAGAYITGTVVQPASPSAFTTAALGIDFLILDENGHPADTGDVALVPPSIGLSTKLLNKDHHQAYYQNMSTWEGKILRRHGDQIKYYANGFFRLLGRSDDTMKLSGIKISSAEIEVVLNAHPLVQETAAIAFNPKEGGPSQLIIYAVLKPNANINSDKNQLKIDMQNMIKQWLNPLFKIEDVLIIDHLPRTASNKVMRRILRDQYHK